jgi:3-mercaptopyruvate sulfurtransferase SseA
MLPCMGGLFERGFADTMVDKGYAHPDLLWSPQELEARLGDPHLRIIDVRPTHALVQEGWIPGAIHFDLSA